MALAAKLDEIDPRSRGRAEHQVVQIKPRNCAPRGAADHIYEAHLEQKEIGMGTRLSLV